LGFEALLASERREHCNSNVSRGVVEQRSSGVGSSGKGVPRAFMYARERLLPLPQRTATVSVIIVGARA